MSNRSKKNGIKKRDTAPNSQGLVVSLPESPKVEIDTKEQTAKSAVVENDGKPVTMASQVEEARLVETQVIADKNGTRLVESPATDQNETTPVESPITADQNETTPVESPITAGEGESSPIESKTEVEDAVLQNETKQVETPISTVEKHSVLPKEREPLFPELEQAAPNVGHASESSLNGFLRFFLMLEGAWEKYFYNYYVKGILKEIKTLWLPLVLLVVLANFHKVAFVWVFAVLLKPLFPLAYRLLPERIREQSLTSIPTW